MLFDLLVLPALLWRRTRALAFILCLGFHLTNAWMFNIGIFPWFMIAATTLFLEPDWPRRVKLLFVPFCGGEQPNVYMPTPSRRRQWITIALLCTYLAAQILIPFRHLLYPGMVHWNEEGHRWSWHMKLRAKDCRGVFVVHDPVSGKTKMVRPQRHLERHQDEMLGRPDMILQFAHFLADQGRAAGYEQAEVRARIRCSLNGRPHQVYIDPNVDLAAQERTLGHVPWVVPLTTPLDPDATR